MLTCPLRRINQCTAQELLRNEVCQLLTNVGPDDIATAEQNQRAVEMDGRTDYQSRPSSHLEISYNRERRRKLYVLRIQEQ